MHNFTDKIAVVTGGGTGIGRELVRQLAAAGARVAMCDVAVENMDQTVSLVHDDTPDATVLTHRAEVSDESQLEDFRDTTCSEFDTNPAYSTAKFAVKGFSEALITDLRINAPHVKVALVMPGHIGTPIVENTVRIQAVEPTPEEAELYAAASRMYEETAPMSAAEAATIILDGVRDERWRILVGDDAVELDEKVRAAPETAHHEAFFTLLG